jgi:hypothetical protein
MLQKSQISTLLQKLLPTFILFRLTTAYLEPGSSSFLLKILISSLVALVIFFRQIWGYARAVWGKLASKRAEPVDQSTAVPPRPPQNEIQ